MDEESDQEPQHFLGMPVEPGRTFPGVGPTEQRVLGVPVSWYRRPTVDLSGVRHPVRWIRWRIRAHRLGAYAPDREAFLTAPNKQS